LSSFKNHSFLIDIVNQSYNNEILPLQITNWTNNVELARAYLNANLRLFYYRGITAVLEGIYMYLRRDIEQRGKEIANLAWFINEYENATSSVPLRQKTEIYMLNLKLKELRRVRDEWLVFCELVAKEVERAKQFVHKKQKHVLLYKLSAIVPKN
jgi:hypothetical protein